MYRYRFARVNVLEHGFPAFDANRRVLVLLLLRLFRRSCSVARVIYVRFVRNNVPVRTVNQGVGRSRQLGLTFRGRGIARPTVASPLPAKHSIKMKELGESRLLLNRCDASVTKESPRFIRPRCVGSISSQARSTLRSYVRAGAREFYYIFYANDGVYFVCVCFVYTSDRACQTSCVRRIPNYTNDKNREYTLRIFISRQRANM